jgi:CRP/FNR family transcriptional regulator, cyclic AMP receptor protein
MSDAGVVGALKPPVVARDVMSLLEDVALFAGIPADDLEEFASAFARVEVPAGELIWRMGTAVEGLHVLVNGEVQVSRCLPGQRELELARLGPGAVMGEIPLLGGGPHSATVRALSRCSLLFLDRAEFDARMRSRRPSAFELRRRIVAIACDRLRAAHATLRDAAREPAPAVARGEDRIPSTEPAALPSRTYIARLPFFRDLHEEVVTQLLDAGESLQVGRRRTIVPEGAHASRCFVVLNGAVEEVVPRPGGTTRVGFAGPGSAFGYLGLLDGRPASATWVARERSRLLAITARDFDALLERGDERARAFAAAIEHDLVGGLATAERAKSHLAAASAP